MTYQEFEDWLHDDICWCIEKDCQYTECMRNLKNRRHKDGYFTASMLKGTAFCALETNTTADPKKLEEIKSEREWIKQELVKEADSDHSIT